LFAKVIEKELETKTYFKIEVNYSSCGLYRVLKSIDRSFELRGEIRLIGSEMRLEETGGSAIFLNLILNGLHHKISKKPIVAA
jgi:hypothetical protein